MVIVQALNSVQSSQTQEVINAAEERVISLVPVQLGRILNAPVPQ